MMGQSRWNPRNLGKCSDMIGATPTERMQAEPCCRLKKRAIVRVLVGPMDRNRSLLHSIDQVPRWPVVASHALRDDPGQENDHPSAKTGGSRDEGPQSVGRPARADSRGLTIGTCQDSPRLSGDGMADGTGEASCPPDFTVALA